MFCGAQTAAELRLNGDRCAARRQQCCWSIAALDPSGKRYDDGGQSMVRKPPKMSWRPGGTLGSSDAREPDIGALQAAAKCPAGVMAEACIPPDRALENHGGQPAGGQPATACAPREHQ
jgi:hypothetical protein